MLACRLGEGDGAGAFGATVGCAPTVPAICWPGATVGPGAAAAGCGIALAGAATDGTAPAGAAGAAAACTAFAAADIALAGTAAGAAAPTDAAGAAAAPAGASAPPVIALAEPAAMNGVAAVPVVVVLLAAEVGAASACAVGVPTALPELDVAGVDADELAGLCAPEARLSVGLAPVLVTLLVGEICVAPGVACDGAPPSPPWEREDDGDETPCPMPDGLAPPGVEPRPPPGVPPPPPEPTLLIGAA